MSRFAYLLKERKQTPIVKLTTRADELAGILERQERQFKQLRKTPANEIDKIESIAQEMHQKRVEAKTAFDRFDTYLKSRQWTSREKRIVHEIVPFAAQLFLTIQSNDNMAAAYIRHLKGDDSEPPIPLFIAVNDDGTFKCAAVVRNDEDAEYVKQALEVKDSHK